MTFQPQVGGPLTILLPSEAMRARVTRIIDFNTCIVEIGQPMMRTHSYRLGDLVAVRRRATVLGETWEAIELPRVPVIPDPEPEPIDATDDLVADAPAPPEDVTTKPPEVTAKTDITPAKTDIIPTKTGKKPTKLAKLTPRKKRTG